MSMGKKLIESGSGVWKTLWLPPAAVLSSWKACSVCLILMIVDPPELEAMHAVNWLGPADKLEMQLTKSCWHHLNKFHLMYAKLTAAGDIPQCHS